MAEDKKEFLDFTGLDHYDEKLHESINDYTTGINLLRGTRDFIVGTDNIISNNVGYFSNGWGKPNPVFSFYKDEEGFTVCKSSVGSSSTTTYGFYDVINYDYKKDDVITISFDLMVDDVDSLEDTIVSSVGIVEKNTALFKTGTSNRIHIDKSATTSGEWTKIVYYYKISEDKTDDTFLALGTSFKGNSIFNWKCFKAEIGKIENPVWSASPFDLASSYIQDSINDYTTGINLARETKDFRFMSSSTDDQGSLDRWINYLNIFKVIKDEDGYGVLNINRSGNDGPAYIYSNNLMNDYSLGDVLTISFDIMIDDVSSHNVSMFGGLLVRSSELKNRLNKTFLKSAIPDMQSGVWYNVVYHMELDVERNAGDIVEIYFYGQTPCGIHFRKPMVQRGRITNPIWAPSPLDVDYINDETTGINLARGTRNFEKGTKTIQVVYRYTDGFSLNASNDQTITKDSQGFSIVNFHQASAESTKLVDCAVSSVSEVENPGETYTASFEFMIDNYDEWNNKTARFATFNATNENLSVIGSNTASLGSLQLDKVEPNKWYKAKVYLTTPANAKYVFLSLQSSGNVSIHFKKLAIYKDRINNPVWSASPFDTNYINDYTTGINLLHGTQKFTIGSTLWTSALTMYMEDGFFVYPTAQAYNVTYEKDENGFTIATLAPSSANYNMNSSLVHNLAQGDIYTISGEFYCDDVDGLNTKNILSAYVMQDNGNSSQSFVLTTSQINAVSEKWIEFSYPIVLTLAVPNNSALFVRLLSHTEGTVKFRKLSMIKGRINNSVWSISPYDIARINDETTGVNLLRGTRDFILGTESNSVKECGGRYTDGFANASNYTFSKDSDGFTIATKEGSGSFGFYGSLIKADNYIGSELTVFADVKLSGSSDLKGTDNSVSFGYFDESGSYHGISIATLNNIFDGTLVDNEWKQGVIHGVIPLEAKWILTGFNKYSGTGSVSYRKCGAYEGHIENPVWSASPFDTEYINDETVGVNLIKGTRDFVKGTVLTTEKLGITSYDDGWNFPSFNTSTYKDTEGFTVVHMSRTGQASDNPLQTVANAIYDIKKGDKFSISFDYMTENRAEIDNGLIFAANIYDSGSRIQYLDCSLSKYFTNYDIKDGEWINLKVTFEVTSTVTEKAVFSTRFVLARNGSSHFRKLCIYKDDKFINNPSWSANPFDLDYKAYPLLSKGTRILPNTDFNNLKDEGTYYINAAADTESIQNIPKKSGQRIFSFKPASSNAVENVNISFTNDLSPNVFLRRSDYNWREFEFKEDPKPYPSGLYTGQNLEKKFASEIGSNHIANWLASRASQANFTGLHIGDFVNIVCDGVTMCYRIGAIDPYYGCGETSTSHHIVMIPDNHWVFSTDKDGDYAVNGKYIQWKKSENNNNGTETQRAPYLASDLHKWEIEKMLPRFPKEWQDVMLEYQTLLETRYSASSKLTESTGWTWANLGKIWSLSETEVFGQCVWGTKGYTIGMDCQFPIFNLTKNRGNRDGNVRRVGYWLRDVVSGEDGQICSVGNYQYAGKALATNTGTYALPCFMIG